jgi:hypothetical protein
MTFTRRTHIVRIPDPDNADSKDASSGNYIDVEVLDAIAFRIENNKEVVLNLDPTKSDPYIVDDTGGGHDRVGTTSRSHMTRVSSDDGTASLDIEVADCWAARDQNGNEWILDMQPGSNGKSAFNISDQTGDPTSTRRQHNEIISMPSGQKKDDAGSSYITSVRTDTIAFRKLNGNEVIIYCPSCDDENAENVQFGRASTFTTPDKYDPSDTSDNAVVPPTLKDSGDSHNYVNFVKGDDGSSKSIFLQDKKIDMGPFWWIRKINSGGNILTIILSQGTFSGFFGNPGADADSPGDQNSIVFVGDGIKLLRYVNSETEFFSPGESLAFETPKGDFTLKLFSKAGADPSGGWIGNFAGFLTAAIYSSSDKKTFAAYQLADASIKPDSSNTVAPGTPQPPAGNPHDPDELQPETVTQYAPGPDKFYFDPPGADNFFEDYGGDFDAFVSDTEKSKDPATKSTRMTRFFLPGMADGEVTVLPGATGDGAGISNSGSDTNIQFLTITYKSGKLNVIIGAPPT